MSSTFGSFADDVAVDMEEQDIFVPLEKMPTGRLTDIVHALDNGHPSVINLDACIPKGDTLVLQTLLYKIESNKSVRTLSLRFNTFNDNDAQIIEEWLSRNDNLETLYLLGSGIEGNRRNLLETAWKRNLRGHHVENMGYTFIRVPFPAPAPPQNAPG